MRLTQELRPSGLQYAIALPAGWVVIVETDTGALRALLAGRVSHRDNASLVELAAADFSLRSFDLSSGSLATHAEAQMARNLRQGEPERFNDWIGGHAALGYSWADGVMDIATWFVEPRPSVGVRVDHAIEGLGPRVRTGVSARAEGASLLATVTW